MFPVGNKLKIFLIFILDIYFAHYHWEHRCQFHALTHELTKLFENFTVTNVVTFWNSSLEVKVCIYYTVSASSLFIKWVLIASYIEWGWVWFESFHTMAIEQGVAVVHVIQLLECRCGVVWIVSYNGHRAGRGRVQVIQLLDCRLG